MDARDIPDLLDAPGWQVRAACAGSAPEVFTSPGRFSEATAICSRCPVRGECLSHAIEHDERFGVWGGLLPRERDRLGGHTPRDRLRSS